MPTILIVDDNADLKNILADILAMQGYGVLTAEDGEDAWEVLQSKSADVVLTDIDMPRLDGVALSQRISDSARHRDVAVILVSGKPLAVKPIHVFDMLKKPIGIEMLLSSINGALSSINLR